MTRVKSNELGVQEMYEYYKEKVPVEKQVDIKMFKKIFYAENKKISERILKGEVYKIPSGLGYLTIRKIKMVYSIKRFDFGTYKKTGIKAYHTNRHSDNYVGRWFWYKSRARVRGKIAYSFVASRDNKRLLAKNMKLNHRQYFEK